MVRDQNKPRYSTQSETGRNAALRVKRTQEGRGWQRKRTKKPPAPNLLHCEVELVSVCHLLSSPTKPPATSEGLLLGSISRENKHTQLQPATFRESKWRTHLRAAPAEKKPVGPAPLDSTSRASSVHFLKRGWTVE